MKIGFYRDALIGDNLVSVPAMYAIKALYPVSTLIVYTNTIGLELYKQYDFIDQLYNMDNQSQENIKNHINSHHFEIFILTQANRWRCKLLNQTNVQKVISLLSLGSIFKPRFHTIFISRNLSTLSQHQRMLALVRQINPKHFDKNFEKIDFSSTILHSESHHKEFIRNFLAPYKNYKTLVMINPFSRTCSHNLTLAGWFKLTKNLASLYPQILFIIPTYEGNPTPLEFESKLSNIVIFRNNSDLFNLIELISRLSLLISPSTGNAHIANNLNIPLLGLFSKRDTLLWRGENMKLENLILIPEKKEKMSQETENQIISLSIKKFEEIIYAKA